MKLCFVLPSVPHYRRGLFKSLAQEASINDLVVLGGYGASQKVIKTIDNPYGFRVYYQQLRSIAVGKISVKFQQGLLYRLIKERPSHVIILYHMSIINHTLVPLICKTLGIRVFFWGSGSGEDLSIRGQDYGHIVKIKLKFKNRFYGLFDGIIAYSRIHEERLRRQNVELPICVAQNTCDVKSMFNIPFNLKNDRSLLFIGALESVKRLDILIKALSLIDSWEWNLNIIGAGRQKEYLQRLTKELNLNDRIIFHGALYNQETLKFWHSASCVVLPGVGGLFINEAMAAGKYVLATSGDGTGEDLLLEEDLLSHDVSVEELARYINHLFALDNEQYTQKCRRNRNYANNNLRIEHMRRELLTILKR